MMLRNQEGKEWHLLLPFNSQPQTTLITPPMLLLLLPHLNSLRSGKGLMPCLVVVSNVLWGVVKNERWKGASCGLA